MKLKMILFIALLFITGTALAQYPCEPVTTVPAPCEAVQQVVEPCAPVQAVQPCAPVASCETVAECESCAGVVAIPFQYQKVNIQTRQVIATNCDRVRCRCKTGACVQQVTRQRSLTLPFNIQRSVTVSRQFGAAIE